MSLTEADVYFDMYDRDIYNNPYPAYRTLREEAPLYYNERYNFYAVSRFEDAERVMVDRDTFVSSRGMVYNIMPYVISGDAEIPKGLFICEDAAAAYHPQGPGLASIHAEAGGGYRARDSSLLCRGGRGPRRRQAVRLGEGHRGRGPDAGYRDAGRHSRCRPGRHAGPLQSAAERGDDRSDQAPLRGDGSRPKGCSATTSTGGPSTLRTI